MSLELEVMLRAFPLFDNEPMSVEDISAELEVPVENVIEIIEDHKRATAYHERNGRPE